MIFIIIPSNLNDQIEFYEKKLIEYTNQAKEYALAGFEIPLNLMSLGINASVNIRNLKIRLRYEND